jgi:hypothetical protein
MLLFVFQLFFNLLGQILLEAASTPTRLLANAM